MRTRPDNAASARGGRLAAEWRGTTVVHVATWDPEVTAGLHRARQELHAVKIARNGDFDDIEGFVLDIGRQWVLLAVLDASIVLDGFAALRIEDIHTVDVQASSDFIRKALTLREFWPPSQPPRPVGLADVRELLSSSAGATPLVTVHLEETDPDCCYIGVVREIDTDHVALLEVTPSAEWELEPTSYPLDEITRVDLGGRYEDALFSIAGHPPDNTTDVE